MLHNHFHHSIQGQAGDRRVSSQIASSTVRGIPHLTSPVQLQSKELNDALNVL